MAWEEHSCICLNMQLIVILSRIGVMNTENKELAIPIPALIGQMAWREERTTNINDAIKALVTAINVERDGRTQGARSGGKA